MSRDLSEIEFQRLWRKLQSVGLNAYEARSYLVLIGHPRFKALELAARSHVPRQKIYEVLDSLVEKGFAQVVQEKTKLFSAVEPSLALPGYVEHISQRMQHEITEQARLAAGLVDDLKAAYTEGKGGRGTLDFLQIVSESTQTATQYRRMLSEAQEEYLEFSRPPYAVDPFDEELLRQACARGVKSRLLLESGTLDEAHRARLLEYVALGVEVRTARAVPLKMAQFDGRRGLIALLDPVITKPSWTSLVFDHPGLAEALRGLFEDRWSRAEKL
jgi:HTH-type transcriptional regulator, sugar sensing transcriptional regulator